MTKSFSRQHGILRGLSRVFWGFHTPFHQGSRYLILGSQNMMDLNKTVDGFDGASGSTVSGNDRERKQAQKDIVVEAEEKSDPISCDSEENHEVKLSQEEVEIHRVHQAALKKNEKTYIDPKTGLTVFSEKFHLDRGSCCGSACRHCPFGLAKVPPHLRKMKKFNSLFYF